MDLLPLFPYLIISTPGDWSDRQNGTWATRVSFMRIKNRSPDLNVINAFQNYEQQKKALALEEENILLARENLRYCF